MTFRVRVDTTGVSKIIAEMIKARFNEVVLKASPYIEKRITAAAITALKTQPEYNSLLYDKLRGEFGLLGGNSRCDDLFEQWTNSVETTFINGKLTIRMFLSGYEDVINTPAAIQETEKGDSLHWLEWLLLKGDKTVIRSYVIKTGPSPASRTGLAVMVKQKRGKWSVPPEFAGTKRNNWITRAIETLDTQIYQIIEDEITPVLG